MKVECRDVMLRFVFVKQPAMMFHKGLRVAVHRLSLHLWTESVKFIVCELGEETESFVLHLFAAMAERERLVIGARNKAALAAAKARGVRLGGPNINQARALAHAAVRAIADRNAANVLPIIEAIRKAGATSLHQIAEALNVRGVSTPRGGRWHAKSVANALARSRG
jgi:DNA invertase Pin-like site-specific DNA recombinase